MTNPQRGFFRRNGRLAHRKGKMVKKRRQMPSFLFFCLGKFFCKSFCDFGDKLVCVDRRGFAFGEGHEVFCHYALFQCVEACFFKFFAKSHKVRQIVKLAALFKRTAPREYGCHRVCGSCFPFEMFVIVFCDRTVSGLILVFSVRRNSCTDGSLHSIRIPIRP